MKSEENKSFSQIIREIESDAYMLRDFPDDYIRNASIRIENNTKEAKLTIRGLRIISFLAGSAFIGSLIMLIFTINYYNKSLSINNYKDSKFDSISNKILGVEKNIDTLKLKYAVDEKDSILSYPRLMKEHEVFNKVHDSLMNYKAYENIIEDAFNVRMKIDTVGNTYIIGVRRTKADEKSDFEKALDKIKPQVRNILKDKDSIK